MYKMKFLLPGLVWPLFFMTAQTSSKLRFEKLTDSLYLYTTQQMYSGSLFPSNSLYLVTKEGVVLIDTPWDESQFQPLLDSIQKRHGQKVVMCIATHFHEDSTAGLEYYAGQGIATWSSRYTRDLCREHSFKEAQYVFEKDTVFNVGGYAFEAFYPGEGHTKDNITVWLAKDKVLYGGCLVKSHVNDGLGNIADANISAWDETIKRLMEKYRKPAFVVPGHFAWSRGHKALKHTLKILKKEK